MEEIKHWTCAIKKWEQYKAEHPEATEVLKDFENFFGTDYDGELSKFCANYYYDITAF